MNSNSNETDKGREHLFENHMDEAKTTSAAARDFFGAAQGARRQAEDNGILPVRNKDGEFRWTIQQGLKAACHAREDISATLQIQLAILKRLDRNRNLLWVAIAILGYVAYRNS